VAHHRGSGPKGAPAAQERYRKPPCIDCVLGDVNRQLREGREFEVHDMPSFAPLEHLDGDHVGGLLA
jgi:hypothetical protein